MAEIDDAIERLDDMLRVFLEELCPDDESSHWVCYGFAADALHKVKAHLRAPKGELEEARAELGAWLVDHPGATHHVHSLDGGRRLKRVLLPAHGECHIGEGPTEAAAIRAALSRARGEGT